jgi:DNA-directed RNA polymerase specialized sigma24 family protein
MRVRLRGVRPEAREIERLKRAILALPPLQRDVFLVCRFSQWTYEEVAVRFGLVPNVVERTVAQALAALAKAAVS